MKKKVITGLQLSLAHDFFKPKRIRIVFVGNVSTVKMNALKAAFELALEYPHIRNSINKCPRFVVRYFAKKCRFQKEYRKVTGISPLPNCKGCLTTIPGKSATVRVVHHINEIHTFFHELTHHVINEVPGAFQHFLNHYEKVIARANVERGFRIDEEVIRPELYSSTLKWETEIICECEGAQLNVEFGRRKIG